MEGYRKETVIRYQNMDEQRREKPVSDRMAGIRGDKPVSDRMAGIRGDKPISGRLAGIRTGKPGSDRTTRGLREIIWQIRYEISCLIWEEF